MQKKNIKDDALLNDILAVNPNGFFLPNFQIVRVYIRLVVENWSDIPQMLLKTTEDKHVGRFCIILRARLPISEFLQFI